jgi:hypothetical protein
VKEINKNREIERNVLFLFKIIPAYFDACVAVYKKFLKTVSKGSKRAAFSITASPFFEGIIYVRKQEI